jgi:hypothetical protein
MGKNLERGGRGLGGGGLEETTRSLSHGSRSVAEIRNAYYPNAKSEEPIRTCGSDCQCLTDGVSHQMVSTHRSVTHEPPFTFIIIKACVCVCVCACAGMFVCPHRGREFPGKL